MSTRTQLDIIAQLNDRTVTDEVRLAIESRIDKITADPAIRRRAAPRHPAGLHADVRAGRRGAQARRISGECPLALRHAQSSGSVS